MLEFFLLEINIKIIMILIIVFFNFMIGCNDYFLNGFLYEIKFVLKIYECKYFCGNNSFIGM